MLRIQSPSILVNEDFTLLMRGRNRLIVKRSDNRPHSNECLLRVTFRSESPQVAQRSTSGPWGVVKILNRNAKALAPLILFAILSGCKVTKEKPVKNEPTDPTPTAPVVTPAPPPATTAAPSPSLFGEVAIASEFDINSELISAPIPASAAPDVVGAFRFICTAGQLLKDDPIVYPGQAGKSHLHQFYGNTAANASSTYSSLRKGGQSTCMSPLNRSAYWMPAMLDGKGNVVRPDHIQIYYKRRPQSDPKCSLTSGDPKAEGNCVDLPNGLKFVFGYDMVTNKTPTGAAYFNCKGTGATAGHYSTIAAAVGKCVSGGQLGAVIKAPDCWDGKTLDSTNHRDHMAYSDYGTWGYRKCPSTHPYVVPGFTLQAWYTIAPGDDLKLWKLSSDDMRPDLPHGSTFHADFFMAWDPTIAKMWHDNCINKMLNCSGGVLGNGKMMKQFAGFSWSASPRLVAAP